MATSFYATQTQKIIICVTATSFYATQTKKKYYLCYGKIIQCNKSFQYLFELHWFVMMRWWLCLTKPIIHQVQVIKKNITKPWAPEKLNNFILVCRLWGWFRNRITPNHPFLEGLVQTCMYYTCQSHIQWLFLFLLHHFSIDWLACSSVAIRVLHFSLDLLACSSVTKRCPAAKLSWSKNQNFAGRFSQSLQILHLSKPHISGSF